ncbi:phosphoenolpyruvate-utilizing N-terminal domain-containing protein, partial [Pseudomonas sp. 79_C]
ELVAEPGIAADALPVLLAAIEQGLGEEVEPLPQSAAPVASAAAEVLQAPEAGSRIHGVGAAPGIASGPAHVCVEREFDYPLRGESCAQERQKLREAVATVNGELQALVQRSDKAIGEIFVTHQEMLADPALTDDVEQRLGQGESAAAAWMAVIEAAARQQESLHDALLAERAADLRDIGRRVLAQLCGVQAQAEPEQPYVL